MKKLELRLDTQFDYPDEVSRIVKICHDNGYSILPEVANAAWERYSEYEACGWCSLPSNDKDVFDRLMENVVVR